VRWIDEVLDIALERPLQPLPAKEAEAAASTSEGTAHEDGAEAPSRTH
jgi:ATP-dependent Lon protease